MANKTLKTKILQKIADTKSDLSLNDGELGFYRDGSNIKGVIMDGTTKKDLTVDSDSTKADKTYVDNAIQSGDTATLTSAKAYTDSVIVSAGTGVSKEYVDTQDALKAPIDSPSFTSSISMNRLSASTVGEKSVALGENCTASGKDSIALGYQAEATGDWSVAIGNTNIASGRESVAIGKQITASEQGAIAIGYQAEAKDIFSIALGATTSNGMLSTTMGRYNTGTAENCAVAVGGGTSNTNKKDIYILDWDGNANFLGSVNSSKVAFSIESDDGNTGSLTTDSLVLSHAANPGKIELNANISALLTQSSSVETLEIGTKDAQLMSEQLGRALDAPNDGTAGIVLTNNITGQERKISMANILDGAGQFTTVSYYRATSDMTYSTDSLSAAFIGYKLTDKVPLNIDNLGEIKVYKTDGLTSKGEPILTLDSTIHVGHYGAELYFSSTDFTKGLLFMPHTQCAPEIYDDGKSGYIPDQVGYEIGEGVYYVNPQPFVSSATRTLNNFTVAPTIDDLFFVPTIAGVVDKNAIAPIRNFTTDLKDGRYDGDIEYDQGSVHHIWLYRSFQMDSMSSTWGSFYEGAITIRVPAKVKYYQFHEIIPVWQQAAYEFEKNIRSDNFGSAYSNGDLPMTLYAYRGNALGDSWVFGIVLLHFWGERHCDRILMTGDNA